MPGQMAPGGAQPGYNPAAGGQGTAGQSPFGANVEAGSPEYPIQQFLEKLKSGDVSGATDLFSRKATGKAKVFREGKANEETISELQSDLANVKALPSKNLQGKHVIVLEENASGEAPAPVATGSYGRQRRQPQNRGKATRKVQFTVVGEDGQMVIQDIKVHTTTVPVRNR